MNSMLPFLLSPAARKALGQLPKMIQDQLPNADPETQAVIVGIVLSVVWRLADAFGLDGDVARAKAEVFPLAGLVPAAKEVGDYLKLTEADKKITETHRSQVGVRDSLQRELRQCAEAGQNIAGRYELRFDLDSLYNLNP